MLKKSLLLLLTTLALKGFAHPRPLLSVGGGWWMGGKDHCTGLLQAEYKWGRSYWGFVRPEACLIIPEFSGLFAGVGVGIDLYVTKNLVFSPNFIPGYYYQGKGKNLGCPLEFRSALELSWEFKNKLRLGSQFWHISNASLGKKNPGVNAWTVFIAFPL
jgi:lipid A 3-O-deacylase